MERQINRRKDLKAKATKDHDKVRIWTTYLGGFVCIDFMRWSSFTLGIGKKLYHMKVWTAVGTVHSWLVTVTLRCTISIRAVWHAPPGGQHCWLMDNAHLFPTSVTDGQRTSVHNTCSYTTCGVLKGSTDELHWFIKYAPLVASM